MEEVYFSSNEEGTGEIVFNRPNKRNAFNAAMREELYRMLRSEEVQRCKAVVFRAEGPVFCAGVDLNEVASQNTKHVSGSLSLDLWRQFRRTRPVLVAALHGPAYGLGAGIAMACDIVIAGEEVKLGYPEIQHGLVSSFTTVGLMDLIGMRKAFEFVITGRRIGAAEALMIGMVNEVLPEKDVQPRAREMARQIAGFAEEAVYTTKQFFYEAAEMPFSAGTMAAERVVKIMRSSRGAQERAAAFVSGQRQSAGE
jgi:enoyl-CoA hydratase/carnithine racemase